MPGVAHTRIPPLEYKFNRDQNTPTWINTHAPAHHFHTQAQAQAQEGQDKKKSIFLYYKASKNAR